MDRNRLGVFRAYYFGLFICLAGVCCGYDAGVAGGVITFTSFLNDFRIGEHDTTRVSSLIVALQQLGAMISAVGCSPMVERIGRKPSIMLGCLVFNIGIVLEIVPSHSIGLFYAARLIAGLGLGVMYAVVPTYSAEMAPKEIRGRLGSCLQWMFTWGVLISYWIDYGVKQGLPATAASQWQVPLALQMVPAGILGIGLFALPESTRWYAKKGREDDAWRVYCWMRADESAAVRAEFEVMLEGIRLEAHAAEDFKIRELWEPTNRARILIAFNICLAQQATGATSLAYFAPQFFKLVTGPGDRNLLITALFGVIKVVACGIFVLFLAERFGRKIVLASGAIGMSVCMIITAVLVKVKPPTGEGEATPSGIATVAMIFLNIVIYNFSWGPLPYPYMSEIFPSRIRAIGVSTGMASQWLFNFVFCLVAPYMINSLGWGSFLFFGVCDVVMAVWVIVVLRETRGKSIEEMEMVFHSGAGLDYVSNEKELGSDLTNNTTKAGAAESLHVESKKEE